jgi:hypothetical protein
MGDSSGPPHRPATGPALIRRIRHSPAPGAAAMILFLAVSALWLVAAATAQVGVESTPGCLRPVCPQPPSYTSFHVWLLLGTAGAVLTLASFAVVARDAVRNRPWVGPGHRVRRAVVAGFAGALAEVVVVLLVTHVAIVTAPLGFENSGEAGVAIGILAAAQPVLAGALALMWGRLLPGGPGEPRPGTHRTGAWRAVAGLGGMVLSCGAFAAWSLRDGTTYLVHTRLIAGTATITNAGAWWPGLFAAMAALMLIAAACAPGLAPGSRGTVPRAPSASDGSCRVVGQNMLSYA